MLPANEIDSTKVGSYTAFLTKLWKIVNDPSTDDLIRWTEKGQSFVITNQNRFTQELIPKYFKHNNMASFIRQLNMYGFRKVISIEAGGLTLDKGETEFSHPLFIQGQPGLIKQIKRKPQCARTVATTESNPNFSNILAEIQKLRRNQETMGSKVIGIKKENELLWREYASMRQKFSKQQQIIEKLVQFLVAMVKSPTQTISPKRKFSHLALEGIEGSSDVPNTLVTDQDSSCQFDKTTQIPITGPVIHEVTHSNDGELNFLEKVYPANSRGPTVTLLKTPSPSAPSPSSPGPSCNRGEKQNKNEARVKVEPMDSSIYVIPGMKVPGQSNADDFYSSNYPSVTEVFDSVDPLNFGDPEHQIHIINGTDEYNIVPGDCAVTSLGEDTDIETSYDPDLHPELLKTVNPSVVNPNITVNVSNHATAPFPTNANSNPTTATTRGVTSIKKSPGGGKLIVRPSASPSPNGGRMRSISIGKGAKPGGATFGKGKSLSMAKYPSNLQDPQNATPSDLAIPDKAPLNDKDWSNYLDEVQASLDSLQGIFNSGALNVDSSAVLSLFGNENDDSIYIPEQETWPNNLALSGTEVSLYNPSFYDSEEDEIDNIGFGPFSSNANVNTSADAKSVDGPCNLTSSLLGSNAQSISGSPPKRPRLIIKKGERTGINSSTEDDSLSTPRPYLD